MVFKLKNFYIILSPFVFLTILILFLKCKMFNLFLCFFALILHELGHIITAYKLEEKISILKIFPLGFSCRFKNQSQISANKMIKILIAGPAVNFITAGLVFYWTSEFATVNFLMGVLNLLPVYELDGARIVNILLKRDS